jgi:serine/threonine protein phosphatase 1
MGRFFVIGDIHACPQELEDLITACALEREDRLVFLGDYIDRGSGAREVVDFLLDLQADRVCTLTFLKGNHEDMLLAFLGYPGHFGESFLVNGGIATLKSYGLSGEILGQHAALHFPSQHLAFFQQLDRHIAVDDILCVHAGVDPLRSLEQQDEESLFWIRQEFITHPHPLPYTVLFGHTPQREVLLDLPYKVGLDTGLVYGGKLSCLEVTEKKLLQVRKGVRRVEVTDVSRYWKRSAPRLFHTQTAGN